jgi:hypothetical protein
MQPIKRRKRCKSRTAKTPTVGHCGAIPTLDDTDFRLSTKRPATRPNDERRSLPILLCQRESGLWSSRAIAWQERMILVSSVSSRGTDSSPLWRRYALRRFSFRALLTPAHDAVLGFDRSGSYTLALGGHLRDCDAQVDDEGSTLCSNEDPPLLLRFYGMTQINSRALKN